MKKSIRSHSFLFTLFAVFGAVCGSQAQLTLTTTQTNVLCNGDASGSATVIPANGTNNYSYSWSPTGGNNATATGLSAGTYIVTVVDTVSNGVTTSTLYSQGFETVHGWNLNVSTGTNGADPNFWTVSDAEGGVAAGGCGVGTNGNKTLHITSVFNPSGGASYDAGGLCGLLFCPQTSSRAESPSFSTINHTGITLEFDYIANGEGLNDNASVYYNSGAGWQLLTASIKSTVCGNGQGQWTHFTANLPASCNNNAAVQVAINWVNNDDGVGTDPAVAINDVVVKGQMVGTPVYNTVTASVVITEPAPLSANLTVSACGSYVLNGQTYTTSGNYIQLIQNGNGCDSTINLALTINNLPGNGIVTVDETTLESSVNGVAYSWINCATNQVIPNATNQSFTATANGNYAVITNNGTCSDTSNCVLISQVGLSEMTETNLFTLYPNPASEYLSVLFDGEDQVSLQLFTIDGKLVTQLDDIYSGEQLTIGQLNAGVYVAFIHGETGTTRKQFIKK